MRPFPIQSRKTPDMEVFLILHQQVTIFVAGMATKILCTKLRQFTTKLEYTLNQDTTALIVMSRFCGLFVATKGTPNHQWLRQISMKLSTFFTPLFLLA